MEHDAATLRQQIIALLRGRLWEAGELSRALGISQRQVESHLTHLRRIHGGLASQSPDTRPLIGQNGRVVEEGEVTAGIALPTRSFGTAAFWASSARTTGSRSGTDGVGRRVWRGRQ